MANKITIFKAKKIVTMNPSNPEGTHDFAVLDKSPLDVDPMEIKDIPVWGTVVGGLKFQAVQG
jgi:predicted amidohydrolase YtcJ